MSSSDMDRVADWITPGAKTVIFTGAGISTESGIPDFRSPGGIWDRFDPKEMTYQKFISDREHRKKYWAFHRESWRGIRAAEPNAAHLAIAELQNLTDVTAIITQNIDGLHQKAGSDPERVLELHGSLWRAQCLECGRTLRSERAFQQLREGQDIPCCFHCGADLKPGTVAFGEALPEDVMADAQAASLSCDVFIAVGSSLMVYPAAFLPEMAVNAGARLAIINRDPTPQDPHAHVVMHGLAGEILPDLPRRLSG